MPWFTLRTSSLINTSCIPSPNAHCQAAMLGAEQKAFWSAPGQGKGSWFLGRVTDRWCNPEENNQTAELMGKLKILKSRFGCIFLYSLMLLAWSQKKKGKNIKKVSQIQQVGKKSLLSFERKTQRLHTWNKEAAGMLTAGPVLGSDQWPCTLCPTALLALHLQLQLSKPNVCVRAVDPFESEFLSHKGKTSW